MVSTSVFFWRGRGDYWSSSDEHNYDLKYIESLP